MDVGLLVHRTFGLDHELFSEVNEGVAYCRRNGCEGEAVSNSEGCGEE